MYAIGLNDCNKNNYYRLGKSSDRVPISKNKKLNELTSKKIYQTKGKSVSKHGNLEGANVKEIKPKNYGES